MEEIFMQRVRSLLFLLSCAVSAPSLAADVVKLVVPFAAGGPVDQVARIIAPGLTAALGKTVVVENRGGAGGVVGANYVAKSPADGSTLLVATSGYVMSAGTMTQLPYDPRKDLEPVALIGQVQTLMIARPDLGVRTLRELVDKSKSGARISYGSSGVGSTMHIGGEMVNVYTGSKMLHVPYRGAAPAIADLLAGQIDALNADVTILAPYVREGKVRGLVLFDTQRSKQLPDVPTSVEAGYPDLQMSNAYGILAPAGTPAATRGQLEQAILKVVRSPEISERLGGMGLNGPMNTEEFKAKLASDFDRWIPFLKKTGIQVQP